MKGEDVVSQSPKVKRPFHQSKMQSYQMIPYDNNALILKRRVTFSQSKSLKTASQLQSQNPRRKSDFASFTNYKISTEVISFEMEEQRNLQMKAITNDEQLQAYYLAFKKLFTFLYQASQLIDKNNFKLNSQHFHNKSVGFLCLIFERTKEQLDRTFLEKLRPLVRNVQFLANNLNEFQRRIDLVARKVTLQNQKHQLIKNAFLNQKIQRAWEQTIKNYYINQDIETYFQDQFETSQQKFCLIDVKEFIVNKLSTKQFGEQIRKYCTLQQLDDDLSLDFKFEFLLAQEFSFSVPSCLAKSAAPPPFKKSEAAEDNKCFIM